MADYATKEEIYRAFQQRRFTDVVIDDYTFRIQSLSELEQSRLDAAMLGEDGKPTAEGIARARSRLIAAAWVDAAGRRVCTDDEEAFIGSLDARITQRLADAIQAHCGQAGTDEAFAATVKNSSATTGGDSPTA